MSNPKPKKIVCKWCGHSKYITKDLDKAYQQGKKEIISLVYEYSDGMISREKASLQKFLRFLENQGNGNSN